MSLTIPYTFNDGDLIVAEQFNANFTAVANAANSLYITSPQTISADTTWSSRVRVDAGAVIAINDGVTLTINGPFEAGLYPVFNCQGTGQVVFGLGSTTMVQARWFGVQSYGAVGELASDQSAAFKQAVSAAQNVRVLGYQGYIRIDQTIPVTVKGMRFCGQSAFGDSGQAGLFYFGTGACIELGSDNGHAYDAADYDGVQGFSLENTTLQYEGSATSNLLNASGTYGTGTYGIRDWRGGNISLSDVAIAKFEYGFWGIQSDLNEWYQVQFSKNHVGFYLGPRSDQFTSYNGYSALNDTVGIIDGAWSILFDHWASDSDGSDSTYPFDINTAYSRSSGAVTFSDCWFENYAGPGAVPAFIGAGTDTAHAIKNVTVRNPIIVTNTTLSGATSVTKRLIAIGNADGVYIDTPSGRSDDADIQLDSLIEVTNDASPQTIIYQRGVHNVTTYVNSGTGQPTVSILDRRLAFKETGANSMTLEIDPVPLANTALSRVRMFRNVNTSGATELTMYRGDGTSTEVFTLNTKTGDIKLSTAGAGVVMTTPDGTKTYRVSVNNSGTVISTLL